MLRGKSKSKNYYKEKSDALAKTVTKRCRVKFHLQKNWTFLAIGNIQKLKTKPVFPKLKNKNICFSQNQSQAKKCN